MALDEGLLAGARGDLITLRIYAWCPATVSLGYFQPCSRIPPALAARYPLVRRPTGGGALIHEEDEVTFSLTGLATRRAPRPEEAAGWALEGLRRALGPLGVAVRFAGETGPAAATPFFCSSVRRSLDIVADLPAGPRNTITSRHILCVRCACNVDTTRSVWSCCNAVR